MSFFPSGKKVIVDVGHHRGHFIQSFMANRNREDFYIVAIDPIDYKSGLFDEYHQVGISTETGTRKFNLYDEPGCNSLLDMKLQDRVDSLDKEEGWFCAYQINKIGEIEINVVTLESLLESRVSLNESPAIHYLKVDAQGNDLDVLKSIGKDILQSIEFIQLESCVAKREKQLMYIGQTVLDQDVEFLNSNGFQMIDMKDHSKSAPPEADIVFQNTRWIS